ncbi:hypothetical protein COOONC_10768 [Cooperia oncophora]
MAEEAPAPGTAVIVEAPAAVANPVSGKSTHGEKQDKSEFEIKKDQRLPDSQLTVQIPREHPSYDQFIAKVVDVSPSIDPSIRDVK